MQSPLTGPEQNVLLDDLLTAAQAEARLFARQMSLLVQLNELSGREATELSRVTQFPVVELAGTLRQSQQALSSRSAEAERLVLFLPRTFASLASGELLVPQAKALLEVTRNAAPEVTSRVEAALLPELLGWCPPEVRRRASAMVLQVEAELDLQRGTDTVAGRLAAARANRKVTIRQEPDGMAGLWALLPAEKAVRFRHDLDELARRARLTDTEVGITRTADQRRADLLAELPGLVLRGHTGCPGAAAGPVSAGAGAGDLGGAGWVGCSAGGTTPVGILLNVLVPMDTVLDRGVQPGTLVGYGPISAAHVRLLRPAAWVRPVYVDSRSGQPIALGDKLHPPQAEPPCQPGQPPRTKRPPRAERRAQSQPVEQPDQREQAEQSCPVDWADANDPVQQPLPPDQTTETTEKAGANGSESQRAGDDGEGRRAGGAEQHRSRPTEWDEGALRAVVQSFLQPVEVVDVAEPQHDPGRRLTRLLRLRDVHCAGPGCSVPAVRCDRHHLTPYGAPGGVTAAWNLRHLSRRCHRAKHHGWNLTVHPDGRVTWLSPLGRTYRRPAPHQRPAPTDWTRWQDSPRWTPTGLQLLAPKLPASLQHRVDPRSTSSSTAPSTHYDDQDWDWASSRMGVTDRVGIVEPVEEEAPPF